MKLEVNDVDIKIYRTGTTAILLGNSCDKPMARITTSLSFVNSTDITRISEQEERS